MNVPPEVSSSLIETFIDPKPGNDFHAKFNTEMTSHVNLQSTNIPSFFGSFFTLFTLSFPLSPTGKSFGVKNVQVAFVEPRQIRPIPGEPVKPPVRRNINCIFGLRHLFFQQYIFHPIPASDVDFQSSSDETGSITDSSRRRRIFNQLSLGSRSTTFSSWPTSSVRRASLHTPASVVSTGSGQSGAMQFRWLKHSAKTVSTLSAHQSVATPASDNSISSALVFDFLLMILFLNNTIFNNRYNIETLYAMKIMFTTEKTADPADNKLIAKKQLHLRTIFFSSDVDPQYTGLTNDLLEEYRQKCHFDIGEYAMNENIQEYVIDTASQQGPPKYGSIEAF